MTQPDHTARTTGRKPGATRTVLFLLVLAIEPAALAQHADIYAGGSGTYSTRSADSYGSIAYPQVNNAGGATGLTDHVAWLNGTLTCTSASPTTVHVYWGASDQTNNRAAWDHWTNMGRRTAWSMLTTNIAIEPETVYCYRFYATNSQGEAWAWPAESFKSLGAPALGNYMVYYLNPNEVILAADLTAGVEADATVYVGQNTNNWAVTNAVGPVQRGAFSTTVPNLAAGTLYSYRWHATNNVGEAWSPVIEFTTGNHVIFLGGDGDGYDGCLDVATATTAIFGTILVVR